MAGRTVNQFSLEKNQRAERKLLITVVEWEGDGKGPVSKGEKKVYREVLGTRTEDSSIEFNVDITTTTDIRGNNYTDVNKSQPQQAFDPYLVLGGSYLGAFLNAIRKRNALSELSQFTVYVITAYINVKDEDGNITAYEAERHTDCTIAYQSLGGDVNVNFPITLYLSNFDSTDSATMALGHACLGTVDKLGDDFEFTPDLSI